MSVYEKWLIWRVGHLEEMLAVHLKAKKKEYLRCGAHFIVYVGPDTKDPRDAGTEEEDKHTFAKRELIFSNTKLSD